MAIGSIRTATEVSRPAMRQGSGQGMERVARAGAAGVPRAAAAFHAPTGMEGAFRAWGSRFGAAVAESRREGDEREAADAALALQTELAEAEVPLYAKRGLDAGEYAAPDEQTQFGRGIGNGVAAEWSELARSRMEEVSEGLGAEARRRLGERMAPWVAAHRLGLLRHQSREARAGERARVEAGVRQGAANEAVSIAARMGADEASEGADRDGEAAAALLQMGVVAEAGAIDAYDRAVSRGLYTPEEAAALRRKNSGDALRSLMDALIGNGSDKAAEAVLGRIGTKDGEDGEGSVAAECGVGADELAKWRSGIGRVRERRKAEAEAMERRGREAYVEGFRRRELEMDRNTDPEKWATEYEAMGVDEKLDAADPKLARAYRDTAKKLREAAKEAKVKADKAKVEATEDGLMGRLLWLISDREDGRIDQDAVAERQAALWRDYTIAATGRAVGADFPKKFRDNLGRMLNDQQREAMRRVMDSFGYSGETDSTGRVTAAARHAAEKEGTDYSFEGMEKHWYGDEKISATELMSLLDRVWTMLDMEGKGQNRVKEANEYIDSFKAQWMQHHDFDKAIDGMVDEAMASRRDRLQREELEND